MRRYWIALPAVAALVAGAALYGQRSQPSGPAPADNGKDKVAQLKPAVSLPISQVIMFNSGVGHFTRAGEVDGDVRVDLTFPEQDINDLIKSMTLRDLSPNGRVAAVTYDSHDPIDRTLASFAINLNNSPSFAQILTQARGEQVEVTLVNTANQPGNLTGKIIGVEQQLVPSKDGPPLAVGVLNLWCAEGVRAVKLGELQRLRFANPVIENEVRRALETLALSHDSQKKAVSLHFAGEGKRKVEVGYVIENPIWKTSYRLVLDDKNAKPYLQGWAVVENPTDEDWAQVTMALVSGRPISFRMDLYNPLYVGRPTVEPELFASLRPPTYSGAMNRAIDGAAYTPPGMAGRSGGGYGGQGLGMPGGPGGPPGGGAMPAPKSADRDGRLRGLEAKTEAERLYAGAVADKLKSRMDLGASVASVATASSLGDYFQYIIDRPVDLARQKSALLPIVNKDVEGKRVSIYNQGVQAKHPLLGLKFKNTTGMPLTQGPITVI